MTEYIKCKQEEATHVKIIEKDFYDPELTFGEIYEYHYDAHPAEETYYIILNDGTRFYDFECVVAVEYLKIRF